MTAKINTTVLMSGPDFMSDASAINPYMVKDAPIDIAGAKAEHQAILECLQSAGVRVVQVLPPADCQDGVYTANWALVRGDKAVLSTLPAARKDEEAYAEKVLKDLGKTVFKVPNGLHFSGQGDALPCGNYLFMGSGYRTDPAAHQFVADTLGYQAVSLRAVPKRNFFGLPVKNKDSGWPDSFFYDLDLALSVISPTLIAWCPQAFTPASRAKIRSLKDLEKVEVSFSEAKRAFACNLVSTGKTVIMSAHAPNFKAQLESRGFKVLTPEIKELAKGGGYIRCTTLTLE
jgi:N-dimethylarginine dimethylaminohydrolase